MKNKPAESPVPVSLTDMTLWTKKHVPIISDKKSGCFCFQPGQAKVFFLPQDCRFHSISKHVTNPYPEPDCLLWICLRICDKTFKFFLLKWLLVWKYPWNFLFLKKYFKSLFQNTVVQYGLWQNIYVREKRDRKHLNISFFEHFFLVLPLRPPPPILFWNWQVTRQIPNFLFFSGTDLSWLIYHHNCAAIDPGS